MTTVPPGITSIAPGQNLSLAATTTNSDGSLTVVTGTAQWASSASSLISIAGPGVVAASASAGGSLILFAANPGIWGNTLRVSISTLPSPNTNRFNLLLQQVTSTGQLTTLESYVNLSVSPSDPNYVVALIDNDSNYITFANPSPGANGQIIVPTAAPAATAAPVAFSGGADGTVLVPTDQNFELAVLASGNAERRDQPAGPGRHFQSALHSWRDRRAHDLAVAGLLRRAARVYDRGFAAECNHLRDDGEWAGGNARRHRRLHYRRECA